MTLATLPPLVAPGAPVPKAPAAVPDAPESVPDAPAAVSTPRPDRSERVGQMVTWLAVVGGAILAGIGFAGSYSALEKLGVQNGFGGFAAVFPIGLDVGIVVLLALDLQLIRKGTPWPVLRLLAHTFTVATIVFNAASAGPIRDNPIGAGMHAVIPVMFIAAVEAGRRLVIKAADIQAGRESVSVPMHRWVLAPVSTGRIYRRMRLWAESSYTSVVAREQELRVYKTMLEREHGSVRSAPSEARLPLTMARYGLTVREALELPERHAKQEQERRQAKATRLLAEKTRAEELAAQAEIARMRTAASLAAERHLTTAQTGEAEARAQAALSAAQRAAALEEQALESVATAEAKARAAEAERRAAEARRAAAETQARAAETEQAAAETKRRALETAAAAAEAEARRKAADADAAEAERRAAEARRAAAETEARAVEMEDRAALKPSERAARKVARMALTQTGGDAEALALETIADALGVSVSTASERRKEAAQLLAQGYRP